MFKIDLDWKTVFAILVAVLVLLWLARRQAAEAAEVIADVGSTTLNPVSRENFIYRGVNALVDVLDDGVDNDSNTLGTIAYDWEIF